jgi:anti-sigma B factor antagonist
MQIRHFRTEDAVIVRILESRLDAAVAIMFKEMMRDTAVEDGTRVVLDLSQVQFLDSSGLGAIVGVMKLLGPTRPLEIAALSPAVRKLFRLTRMDTVFRIHDRAPVPNETDSHTFSIAG